MLKWALLLLIFPNSCSCSLTVFFTQFWWQQVLCYAELSSSAQNSLHPLPYVSELYQLEKPSDCRTSIRKTVDKQDQKLRARGRRRGWTVSNNKSFSGNKPLPQLSCIIKLYHVSQHTCLDSTIRCCLLKDILLQTVLNCLDKSYLCSS